VGDAEVTDPSQADTVEVPRMTPEKIKQLQEFYAQSLSQAPKRTPEQEAADLAGMQNVPYPYGEGYQNISMTPWEKLPPASPEALALLREYRVTKEGGLRRVPWLRRLLGRWGK
jgi:hypothetical protein